MNILLKVICPVVVGGAMLNINSAQAIDVNVRITGEILIPPCKINNDAVVNVTFGKIALQKVDGVQSAVSKTLDVNCDYYQGTPYIVVAGNAMTGVVDKNVLETAGDNAGRLGIALYQGNGVNTSAPMKIGTGGDKGAYGYPVIRGLSGSGASGQFTFTAVPWKKSTAQLLAGQFSATATMSISYL
ncbi:fimbrial protein [Salmonella enterica]|uniref:Fimbrial protein n=1 Tax=Salmonella enterica TaxID=28901 RepID=A0A5T8T3C1_SALER|nr:fimbrial protein [Salmonella enterica]EBN7838638.1 fimbrial protein [Salmonella enterica]ECE2380511.1 fimbrial protein [Salmonella enterica]